ncbi:transposase [Salinibacter ruber]|uniref:transposase n=1 Tax=Salinibacter ruber TaxID=146919 RepID=UPI003C6E0323
MSVRTDASKKAPDYSPWREADSGGKARLRVLLPLRSSRAGDGTAVSRRTRPTQQRLLSGIPRPVCRSVSPQPRAPVILDNGAFHKAKKLSVPRNVRLIFLPAYSPELNPVERLWQDLKDQVAFDLYKSLAALRQEVRSAVATYTGEAVASLTGYDYLVNAADALSS